MSRVSNWPRIPSPDRSADQNASRPESQNWEPRRPGSQEPKYSKDTEARFHSRIARRAKKIRFPANELEKWEIWCTVHRLDFQDLATEAIRFFLASFGSPGAQAPTDHDLDDQIDDEDKASLPLSSDQCDPGSPGAQAPKTKAEAMLDFYARHSNNRLRPKDYEAYEEVANFTENEIKWGILVGMLRAPRQPNSFAYFVRVIKEEVASGDIPSVGIIEMHARTFHVRMQMKNKDKVDYDEYFANLKKAARGQQPSLPGTAGELKELK
jgi:hypothetical protein